MHQCPICGYDRLPYPPASELICACCGTQFGVQTLVFTTEEIRSEWIAKGAHWHSKRVAPDAGWDAFMQLSKAGIALTPKEKTVLREKRSILPV